MKEHYCFPCHWELFPMSLPGMRVVYQNRIVHLYLNTDLLPVWTPVVLIRQTLRVMAATSSEEEERRQLAEALSAYFRAKGQHNSLFAMLLGIALALGVFFTGHYAAPLILAVVPITGTIAYLGVVLGFSLSLVVGVGLALAMGVVVNHCLHHRAIRQSEKRLKALLDAIALSLPSERRAEHSAQEVSSAVVERCPSPEPSTSSAFFQSVGGGKEHIPLRERACTADLLPPSPS